MEERIEKIRKYLKEEEEWWSSPCGYSSFREHALSLGYSVLIGIIIKTDFEEMVKKSKSFWHKGVDEKKILLLVKRKIREIGNNIKKGESVTANKESLVIWKGIWNLLKN